VSVYSDPYKEEEKSITRIVIFEKCKPYDFVKNGLKYWHDKNGNVIRIDNDDSSLDMKKFIGIKGNSFLGTGYVFAPYVPLMMTPATSERDLFTNILVASNIVSRYSTKGNANYLVCSSGVADILSDL
jgi:hypothetical protein